MPNIFKRKKTILFSVTFSSLIVLASCSSYDKDTSIGKRKAESRGTVTDRALYYPRRLSQWAANSWDRHIRGIPPNWQRYMDLGQPRKPIYNPGGEMYMNQPGEPIILPQDEMVAPSNIQRQSNQGAVPMPNMGATSGYGYAADNNYMAPVAVPQNAASAYVPPPSLVPVEQPEYTPLMPSPVSSVDNTQPLPWEGTQAPIPLSEQDSDDEQEYYEGDVKVNKDGTVPAPVPPWERDPSYLGTGSSSSDYQPVYQDSGESSGVQSPYGEDLTDIGGVVDPYEPGGFEGGFRPPSFDELERRGGDPFAPAQHKYIRVFEPMASEYYYDEDGNVVSKDTKDGFIPVPVIKKKSSKRSISKNMFPLEEYSPKSSVGVNNYFSTPNQDGFVSYSNKSKVNSRIDELIIKLGEDTALATLDANSQDIKVDNKSEQKSVDQKVMSVSAPIEVKEEGKPFVHPRVVEADIAKIIPEKRDIENPEPVKILMPGQEPDLKKEQNLATNPPRTLVVAPPAELPDKKDLYNSNHNYAVSSADNVDEEFEKIKLDLLPIDKSKVEVAPLNSAEILFPANAPVNGQYAPIDIAPVSKVGAVRVEKPLLEMPEISNVAKVQPEFRGEELTRDIGIYNGNEYQEPNTYQTAIQQLPPVNSNDISNENSVIYEEQKQIVVVTPAKNEYVAPPVVNIRKQFEEYRKENRHSGYRLLRGSRYSDRRNSAY